MIVTFDEDGVSGHLNHKAVFQGVSHLMDKKMLSDLEVFTLSSVALFRKYISLADVNFCFPDEWHSFQYDPFWAYRTLAQHATQLVWFRKLFIVFSRYTFINSFKRYVQKGGQGAEPGLNLSAAMEEEGGDERGDSKVADVDESGRSNKATTKVCID